MTIKEMRAETYLSQAKFAKILGIPAANIARWEQGSSSPPDYLVKLIEHYLRAKGLLR